MVFPLHVSDVEIHSREDTYFRRRGDWHSDVHAGRRGLVRHPVHQSLSGAASAAAADLQRTRRNRALVYGSHDGYRISRVIRKVVTSLLFCTGVILLVACSVAAQQKSSCIECHIKLEGELGDPARSIKNDIHLSRGLSCNDCHGGDPTKDDKDAAKDRTKGYLGRPRTADIPAFCGKCHN